MRYLRRTAALILSLLLLSAPAALAADAPPETEAPAPEATAEPTPEPTPERPNYSSLTLQIANARGLNEGDYTAESWSAMQDALLNARYALGSSSQSTVNYAAKTLKNAIEALVTMDYSGLRASLDGIYTFREEHPELYDLWFEAADAVPAAEELFGCGDQAAVDEAAAHLSGLLSQMVEEIEGLTHTEICEIPVEVPPSYDFCNIGKHEVWLILLCVSLGVNVALIIALVLVNRRRVNRRDDTPLVSYDIDDDMYDGGGV